MPVDAFLQRRQLEDRNEVERRRLGGFAVDPDGPRRRLEIARELGRLIFAGAELVEVVIAGDDVFSGEGLFAGVVGGFFDAVEPGGGARGKRRGERAERRGSRAQETATVQIHMLGSDIGIAQVHIGFPNFCGPFYLTPRTW